MSKIHEQYGILSEQFETQQNELAKAFSLLKALKSGEVKMQQLTVTDTGWEVKGRDTPNGQVLKKDVPKVKKKGRQA
ncbi:MAG: hypothetical protein IID39_05725 [Planctomycetes bacterium]|nr:hypothetical protein [Planctomycetota bacterium]